MVKERMDLLELLRKGGMDGDVDFLREALRVLVEGIMDAEVSSRIGAEYGERCPERVTQRNGYRSRAWDTRVGTMGSRVPGSGVKRERVWRKRDHRVILSGQRRKLEKGGQQWSRKGWTCWSYCARGGMDGDVDFLREALRVLVEGIMDAEVSSRIGAEYGERCPERVTQRNGYRSRAWDTRVGTMDLDIPKLREGSYFPSLLEPRRRSERALLAVIQQAYVEGVSTRRVDDLVKALG